MDDQKNSSQDGNQTADSTQPQVDEARVSDEWQETESTIVGLLALLFFALVLFETPRYLDLEGLPGSLVKLLCQAVAVILVLLSTLVSIFVVAKSPSLRALLGELWRYFVVRPWRTVFGRVSPDFLASTVMTVLVLCAPVVIHYIFIVWLGVPRPIEIFLRIVAVLVFMFGALLMAVVVTNLAVKPLFLEFSPGAEAGSQDIRERVSRGLRRLVVTCLLAAEVITAIIVFRQAAQYVLRIFG